MTPDELMKQRYKVIADYPNSIYKVGEIITIHRDYDNRLFCRENSPTYSDYPALFKPLEWWEERDENDLPEYVKGDNGRVYKVVCLHDTTLIIVLKNTMADGAEYHSYPLHPKYYLPATLEEFQSQSK